MSLQLIQGGVSETPLPVVKEKAGVVILLGSTHIVLVRPKNGADEWVLPKGHIEEGESAAVCAVREALEETGAVLHPVTETNAITSTERLMEMPDPDDSSERILILEKVRWFFARAASILTEKITDIQDGPIEDYPRQIGIFPLVVALAKLTYPEHRHVLASFITGGSE